MAKFCLLTKNVIKSVLYPPYNPRIPLTGMMIFSIVALQMYSYYMTGSAQGQDEANGQQILRRDELGQYLAILIEQAWSITHISYSDGSFLEARLILVKIIKVGLLSGLSIKADAEPFRCTAA